MNNKTIYSLFLLFFLIGLILGMYIDNILEKKVMDNINLCDNTYGDETLDYYHNVWNPSIEKINTSHPETVIYSLNLSKVYIDKARLYFDCLNEAYVDS